MRWIALSERPWTRALNAASTTLLTAISPTLYDNATMGASIVTLSLKLEAATKQEGNSWIAWCVPLDVYSQAETKEAALSSLRDAVNLWFESCIERDVLPQALEEAGFEKSKPGQAIPKDASVVEMEVAPSSNSNDDYVPATIEVEIPAYIAAQHLSGICAAH